ncbi:MAG TPA: hypothetical protein PLU53_13575 [Bacteroidia bacterium]|nr:hypothetical protein [Bacteroidia bacterium]
MKIQLYQDQTVDVFMHCLQVIKQMDFVLQTADYERGCIRGMKQSDVEAIYAMIEIQVTKPRYGYAVNVTSSCFTGSSGTFFHDSKNENEFAERFIEAIQPQKFENAFRLRDPEYILAVLL